MQIHEITLKEARPLAPTIAQNVTKLKQQRQARSVAPATTAPATTAPATTAPATTAPTYPVSQKIADYLLHKNPAFASVPRYDQQRYYQTQPAQTQPAQATTQTATTPPAGTTATSTQAAATALPGATIKSAPRPAQPAPATTTPPSQYPSITLGSGPKAQVYVNKGRGYVDSKTGKAMPPAIVKAMGIK